MERKAFEQLGKVAGVTILALGAFAAEGCAQSSQPASVQIGASTLPVAPPSVTHGLPQCTSEGSPSGAIVTELSQSDVQKDIATSFNLSPRDLIGTSLIVKVACAQALDARSYPKITVSNLAGSYSSEGHCALVPVSTMAVATTEPVAACVQTTK